MYGSWAPLPSGSPLDSNNGRQEKNEVGTVCSSSASLPARPPWVGCGLYWRLYFSQVGLTTELLFPVLLALQI